MNQIEKDMELFQDIEFNDRVYHNRKYNRQSKGIRFSIQQGSLTNRYELVLDEIEGTYYLSAVLHEQTCQFPCFCGEAGENPHLNVCQYFQPHIEQLYEAFKTHKNLRLHMLVLE